MASGVVVRRIWASSTPLASGESISVHAERSRNQFWGTSGYRTLTIVRMVEVGGFDPFRMY